MDGTIGRGAHDILVVAAGGLSSIVQCEREATGMLWQTTLDKVVYALSRLGDRRSGSAQPEQRLGPPHFEVKKWPSRSDNEEEGHKLDIERENSPVI